MNDIFLSVSEASRSFADVVNRAYYRGESTLLIRSGVAVARIVPVAPDTVLGAHLAERWKSYPHLSEDEAERFATDLEEAKESIPAVSDPWGS